MAACFAGVVVTPRLARLRRAESAEGRARKAAQCAGVPPGRAASAARRVWVVTAGRVPATVPMWASRRGWLADVSAWADSDEGRSACRAVNMSRRALVALAATIAAVADYSTGRHVGISFDEIAERSGYCSKYVGRALHLLEDAGLAVEAFRGGRWDGRCRTSVWHLVSPRPASATRPGPRATLPSPAKAEIDSESEKFSDHLYPVRGKRSSRGEIDVPSAALAAAPGKNSVVLSAQRRQRRKRRPADADTVSPEARQIGAWLAGHSHGLFQAVWRDDRQHSGGLAIALDRSGLDLTAWSGPAISAAFDADMRARGWYWPNRIEHPAAFLAARLRRLPVRPEGPRKDGGKAAGIDQNTAGSGRKARRDAVGAVDDGYAAEQARWHRAVLVASASMGVDRVLAASAAKVGGPQSDVVAALAHAGRMAVREFPGVELAAALAAWVGRWAPAPAEPESDGLLSGEQVCEACAAAPGIARDALPLRSVVCDHCWAMDGAGAHP